MPRTTNSGGDTTYIKTWDGWAYLATVIDLHSRALVGWAINSHMCTELVTDALDTAITASATWNGGFPSRPVNRIHLQRLRPVLPGKNVTRSLGKTGICYGNTVPESCFCYPQEGTHPHPAPARPETATRGDHRLDHQLIQPRPTPLHHSDTWHQKTTNCSIGTSTN